MRNLCWVSLLAAAGCSGGKAVDTSTGAPGGSPAGSPTTTGAPTGTTTTTTTSGTTTSTTAGEPVFYFVLHADPDTPAGVGLRWDRLVDFMTDLTQRNDGLATPHHVTILFTSNWASTIATRPDAAARLQAWAAAGHQFGFHSHTHNHAFRDGYSNATGLEPDVDDAGTDRCAGDRLAGECTLDYGLQQLEGAIQGALGTSWTPTFGAVGPHDNGGPGDPNGRHDNRCNPQLDANGDPIADENGCLDLEWTGAVATIPYSSSKYNHLTDAMDPDSPEALLSGSYCKPAGDAPMQYFLPHAPLETETGSTAVSVAHVLDALDQGDGSHRIGVVLHPQSYDPTGSAGYAGDVPALIGSLFDEVEARGLRSVTLDEARAIDLARGGGCP